jgi:hypothetical protein
MSVSINEISAPYQKNQFVFSDIVNQKNICFSLAAMLSEFVHIIEGGAH